MSISQLGYIGFEVSDLAAWKTFMTDVLGLALSGEASDGSMAFRNDERAARFLVREGAADDLAFIGLEVADASALAALTDRLETAGVTVSAGSDEEAGLRHVEAFSFFDDPAGNRIELFFGAEMADSQFESSVVRSQFVAGNQGLGHCVLRANDREESERFFCDVLGFKLSDHIICDIGGYKVNIAFMHINPRHHSVALGAGLPKRIHHFMLQVSSLDDLGSAYDRTVDHRLRVTQTLGRHPNDKMVSFYALTPSGFEFEYGWGAREVDDETWEVGCYDHISEWGHRRPPYRRPKN